MTEIESIIYDAIHLAYDGLTTEDEVYVEHLTDKDSFYEDRPQMYRIQLCLDQDQIFPEKAQQIVELIVKSVGMEPDKWTYDGVGEARIYWLDENAEEMAEKFQI